MEVAKPLKWLIVTALLFINAFAYAQKDTIYNRDHLFQPQELHADLAFLKGVLEEAHPSLYRYTPKDTIDALFAGADKKLDTPLTAFDFWKIVAPVVSGIRSAHTAIMLPIGYAPWIGRVRSSIMPLFVFLRHNRIYAAAYPFNTGKMFPGAEILAIDGHPANEILHNVRQYISPEGYSNQFVDYNLETYAFGELYNCVYGFKKQYDIAYADSSKAVGHATLPGTGGAIVYWMKGQKPTFSPDTTEIGRDIQVTTFPDVPSSTLLKINRMNYKKDYKLFDVSFFKRLQDENTRNLIIDLRGNGGGETNLDFDLMRYLVKRTVIRTKMVMAATNKISFGQYLLPGSDNFKQRHLTRAGRHSYESEGDFEYGYAPSPVYHFDGKVYVLIDKGTFSAAAILAADLRSQREVTIVGEESGGGNNGTDCFGFWMVRLPNTSLQLRLPQFWVVTTAAENNTGRGVMPNIKVIPTIADRMMRRDVVLNTTLQMIVSSNN